MGGQTMRKAKIFLLNGITMAVAALLLRFIGMGFNVYLSAKLGAEGMGVLSLLNAVYSLALTLATSGIGLTCTRLCAEALARSKGRQARRALGGCILYSLLFGFLSAFLLYGLSSPIASRILNAPACAPYLRTLALSLPATALSSCLSGYFTAIRKASRSALCALLGQGVKIGLTVLMLSLFYAGGGGVGAVMAATCLSELFSGLFSLLLFFPGSKRDLPQTGARTPRLFVEICSIALPVAFAAWVRSALVSAEHVLIPKGLMKYGAGSSGALASYGMMHGMALPVIFFPAALLSSFTALLIPEISRFHAEKSEKQIGQTSSRMLRITLLFSIGCAAALLFFGKELGWALYKNEQVGRMIALFAPLIPVMYLDTAADAVLKGLDEQVYCMKVNIFDAALSLLLVYLLVPRIGIAGYVLTVFLSESVNTLFSLMRLYKRTTLHLPLLSCLALPLFCALLAALPPLLVKAPLNALGALPALILSLCLYTLCYLLLCTLTGAFTKEDRRYFKRLLPKEGGLKGHTLR